MSARARCPANSSRSRPPPGACWPRRSSSPVDVPGFARAAMDGYRGPRRGHVRRRSLQPARARSRRRGLARPAVRRDGRAGPGGADHDRCAAARRGRRGADGRDRAELEPGGTRVLAREAVSPGRHVGRVGEDVAKGREVLPAGRRLRPQDVGLLASIGAGTVRVVRRPRVAILVTGNELLPPGQRPRVTGSSIATRRCSRPWSPATAASAWPVRYLPDDYAAVRDAIRDADADVVLVSGGSSVGAEDHARARWRSSANWRCTAWRCGRQRRRARLRLAAAHCLPAARQPGLVPVRLRPVRGPGGAAARRAGVGAALPQGVAAAGGEDRLGGRPRRLRARDGSRTGRATPIAVSGASILSTTVAADGFVLVDATARDMRRARRWRCGCTMSE